jgi:REP element-mobilizing transposase RayT
MARNPRITERGNTHHVFSRCIEKRDLLIDAYFADLLIEVITMAQEKYQFELIAYEIMDNHFHFVIKTVIDGPSISRIMQFIKSRFAQRYNMLTGRTGPFWNERFKDTVVEKTERPRHYLLWLLWYLAFNPVRKNLIGDPLTYRYGSINSYLNENHHSRLKITPHEFFQDLGRSFAERVKAFLWYEEAYRKRWAILF